MTGKDYGDAMRLTPAMLNAREHRTRRELLDRVTRYERLLEALDKSWCEAMDRTTPVHDRFLNLLRPVAELITAYHQEATSETVRACRTCDGKGETMLDHTWQVCQVCGGHGLAKQREEEDA